MPVGRRGEDCGGACVEDFCITIVFLPDCLREPGLGTMTQPGCSPIAGVEEGGGVMAHHVSVVCSQYVGPPLIGRAG